MKRFLDLYVGGIMTLLVLGLFACIGYGLYIRGELLHFLLFFIFIGIPVFLWSALEHGGR